MHDGRQAVQIFYIISGFYMALVLSTRYTSARPFYASRFLRIFPVYWIVLAATMLWSLAVLALRGDALALHAYFDEPLRHNGIFGIACALFSNLTLIGQDWILFLRHDAGLPPQFSADLRLQPAPLYAYLVLPQCWSVGIELAFYAMAPMLNRMRSFSLVALAVAMLVARLASYQALGLAHDPWTYRFFPFELTAFIIGMLAYRIYKRLKLIRVARQLPRISERAYALACAGLLLFAWGHQRVTGLFAGIAGPDQGVLLGLPAWLIALPLIFLIFGGHPLDRLIGELSYPVYLVHLPVIQSLTLFWSGARASSMFGITSAVVSVALSYFLYSLVIAPLDRKRHALTLRAETPGRSR